MDNKTIYKKTLGFSLRRVLWDILSLVLILGTSTLGFFIADKVVKDGSGPNYHMFMNSVKGISEIIRKAGLFPQKMFLQIQPQDNFQTRNVQFYLFHFRWNLRQKKMH